MRLRALWLVGALLVGALLLAGRAHAFEVTDDLGRTHRFAQPPARWVSMMPSLTEAIVALGGADRLVGVDRYSNWPERLAALPRLGGLDDAQIEAIAALRPDVVVASQAGRSLDRLEALGVRVLRMQSQSYADVRRSLGLLATLLGDAPAGERLWLRLEAALNAQAARVPPAWQGRRVYVEVGGGPYAAGASSFIGETLARLGLRNIVPVELGPFPKLNPEFVVKAAPELVLGTQAQQARWAARPGWQAIPAVARGALCGFDSRAYDTLVRPGPRLVEAARLVADCLQGLPAPDLRQ